MLSDETIGVFRDRGFALRGKCATYVTVSQTKNTKTGAISETEGEYAITVLTSPITSSKSMDRVFRVRTCELQDRTPRHGDKIVYKDIEYIIVSWKTDQSEYVVDITVRSA